MTTRRRTDRTTPGRAVLAVLAWLGALLLAIPLLALLARAPWQDFGPVLRQHTVLQALALSLASATAATIASLVLGIPLAWWLAAHGSSRGWRGQAIGWLRTLVTLPLVLPPTVGGVALLMAFGRNGVVGRWLDSGLGITLPFTTAAVVLAQTFVAMPFLVVSLEGALAQRDPELEEAAWTMGASPGQAMRHVVLPLAMPSLLAGTVLCWARALGEFGATITFAGNFPGVTQTMPLAVYLAMQEDPRAAVALSVVLLGVSAAVILALRGHWTGGLGRLVGR